MSITPLPLIYLDTRLIALAAPRRPTMSTRTALSTPVTICKKRKHPSRNTGIVDLDRQ